MATLQLKNLPDDLHRALAARAREQGVSMSELVTRGIRRELSRPTIEAWAAGITARGEELRTIDTATVLDAVRAPGAQASANV